MSILYLEAPWAGCVHADENGLAALRVGEKWCDRGRVTRAKGKSPMRKSIVLIAAAALLAGCGGSTSTTAKTSTAASPPALSAATSSTAPTAEQTAWAGAVCTATTTLKKNVQGLASVVTSDGSNVSAAMSAQMTTVKTSANALVTAITAVPPGSESDSEATKVQASADQFKTSITALKSSVAALQGKMGTAKVTALATVRSAASASLSKLSDTTLAIKNAAQDGKSALGQAFASAPACSSLTS